MKPLADHHGDMLRGMQPFISGADANYLGWINRLARIDRHRRLSVMTSYLAEMNPVIALPFGCTAQLQWGNRVLGAGKAEVLRVVVVSWCDDMEVTINPEIEDWSASPSWRRIRYSERFTMLQAFVAGEVAVYEYDCTGTTRNPDLLTTKYKEEADARGPSAQPVKAKQATVWSIPTAGRPSIKASFDGRNPR